VTQEPTAIICYSRCLYCGRRTPHEACHAHAYNSPCRVEVDISTYEQVCALWQEGFDAEPETCNDPNCPVWEPGEWALRQRALV
jgi:hypothetical protein